MVGREKLIKVIKSLSDSIRRKNRALRLGISERDKFLETTFKPVIDPLKEVSQKLEKATEGDKVLPISKSDIKTEEYLFTEGEEDLEDVSGEEEDEEVPLEVHREKDIIEEEEEEEQSETENVPETNPTNISRLGSEIQFKGVLGRKYMLKMLQSTIPNRKYHVYGARVEGDGLMIGNSKLDIDEQDNIIINGKKYKGTIGLFELVFKNNPERYTMKDLVKFKNICLKTNAHRKMYSTTKPIHRNQSVKYKKIISELFPTSLKKDKKRYMSSEEVSSSPAIKKRKYIHVDNPSGEGLLKNTYDTNVIYYNNVNKLVNRMRLIHEAIEAGHTGLQNEWVALVDELINRGIIEG